MHLTILHLEYVDRLGYEDEPDVEHAWRIVDTVSLCHAQLVRRAILEHDVFAAGAQADLPASDTRTDEQVEAEWRAEQAQVDMEAF